MSANLPAEPRPDLRGRLRPYWEAASRGELRLPRCRECGAFVWPPRTCCTSCSSAEFDWVTSAGRGIVHTFTVVRQTPDPYFSGRVPYVVAIIELDEGPRLMSNVVRCDPERVRIGLPVNVAFHDAGDGLAVPVFVPADASR